MVWQNWTQNLAPKILSLVIAVGLWVNVTNRIESMQTLSFPIDYANHPEGLTPLEPLPREVRAGVRGKGRFLRYTTRGGVYKIDLLGSAAGPNTLHLDNSSLTIPGDAEAVWIEPKRIRIEFDQTVVRDVPITPAIVGSPDENHVQVGKTFLNPSTARVKGPRRLVDQIKLLSTVPVEIRGQRSIVRKRVRLADLGHSTVEITPSTIEVGITIEPIVERTIQEIAIGFGSELNGRWTASARPPNLGVEISGARSIVDVAVREVSSIVLHADTWSVGTTILRLLEIRGRDLVYAPHEAVPLVLAPPADNGQPRPPAGPSPRPSGKVPPAVRGEVVGTLPLPPGLEILGVSPELMAVAIQRNGERTQNVARSKDPAPESGP